MIKCRHFGSCGGCKHQDIDYETQLKNKEKFVFDLFGDASEIIPCKNPWHYRNKMEFTFSEKKDGTKSLGLYRSKGGVEHLQECYLTPPWFQDVQDRAFAWWQKTTLKAYYPPKNLGSLRTLTLRGTQSKMIILTVSGEESFALSEDEIASFQKAMPKDASVILLTQVLKKKTPTQFIERLLNGSPYFEEKIAHLNFRIKPLAFFQPNNEQAAIIYSKALELSELDASTVVFDLYSGTGTLGMFAAERAKQVISIELNPDSVQCACENALKNKIENITLLQGDVGKILKTITQKPDLILLDPPRPGLDQNAIDTILSIQPPKILYISCNPLTQARDAELFLNAGYQIKAIQPVDQFPHTPHIENILLMERIGTKNNQ